MAKRMKWEEPLIRWAQKIFRNNLLIFLSFVVGGLSSLMAVMLKSGVHWMSEFLTERFNIGSVHWLYILYPIVGISLTILFIKYFVKGDIGHGIPGILYAISKQKGRMDSHHCYSSAVGAFLTVGTGGSVGLESPAATTGAAIGSRIGRLFHLNYKAMLLLIGCGAAGSIGGIFSAPVAAVVFALEVLLLDLTMSSIIPLLIAAVTGTAVSYVLTGAGAVYSFTVMDPLVVYNLPYYILLGALCGLVSVYFTRCTKRIEHWMDTMGKIAIHSKGGHIGAHAVRPRARMVMQRLFIGGVILGALIFLFPPLFGEGYPALKSILSGNVSDLAQGSFFASWQDNIWLLLLYLTLLLVFKVVAMAVTTGSGGIGGIFAPSLFMGGVFGFIIANLINMVPFVDISSKNFVLAGMAGIMSGVMHAPLTAIFLIMEITDSHALFLPLSLTAAGSFMLAKYIEPHSIYHSRLAKRGELITHDKDKAVLTLLKTDGLVETDFITVRPDGQLGDLVRSISESRRNIFPVVEESGEFMGVVLLDDVRHVIFRPEEYAEHEIQEWMTAAPATIAIGDSMEIVMEKFEKTGAWNLPVLEDGKYIGFLSKSKIFSAYRGLLREI